MRNNAKHRLPKSSTVRSLAAAGIATAVVAAGATAWAQSTPTSTKVVVDSLSLTPASPSATSLVTATAELHATRTLAVPRLTIAVRSADGAHYDFGGAVSTTLGSSRTTFVPQSRSFPAGSYTYFVAYQLDGVWHDLTPVRSFTSGGTGTSGSAAKPSGSGTATSAAGASTGTTAPKPTATGATGATPTRSATASPSSTPAASATSGASTGASAPSAEQSAARSAAQSAYASATASAAASPSAAPSGSASPAGSGPLGMSGSWHSVFDDEFNGTSLDTSTWTPNWLGCAGCTTGPVSSSESEAYAPSQVSVGGGSLHLQAVSEPTTVNGTTYPYRSGMVQTDGKAQFTYGAFEARIYLPPSSKGIANWPAFWTDGQSWPADGEMDVMEGLSGSACFHFHSPSGGPGGCASGDFTGWHTYGADWEPGSVTYYYDGEEVGRITTGVTSAPQYLILNNAVGGSGGQSVAPADMQVDYVRVWQH